MNEQELNIEKIKQEILADEENLIDFIIPLALRDYYSRERPALLHHEIDIFIQDLKEDASKMQKYKDELAEKLDFEYLCKTMFLYENTCNIRTDATLFSFIKAFYELDEIKDEKTRKEKILFFNELMRTDHIMLEHAGIFIAGSVNVLKDVRLANGIVAVRDDEDYLKIDFKKYKFNAEIKSKDDIVKFIKHYKNSEILIYDTNQKVRDFAFYLLGTGTERQTLKDYENRYSYLWVKNDPAFQNIVFDGVLYDNIYTNYDVKTPDGTENYAKRTDTIIERDRALHNLINTRTKDISLKEILDIITFDAEEKKIFAKEVKDYELADLESASTPIKPNSMTYITNKVHQNLSKIDALTGIDENEQLISLSRKKGDIVVRASMETLQDAIYKLDLTPFDELILNATKNLFKENKQINLESIFDHITGNTGGRTNPTTLQDIEKSILTLSGKMIRLDYATKKRFKGKNKGEELEVSFTAPLLPIQAVKVKYKGYEKTFYRLIGTYEENAYFKFTDDIGQLTSTKALYLNNGDKVRNTSENILITNYLVKQITLIKRGSLDTNKISYDKVYALCGIDTNETIADPKEANKLAQRKNRIRANVSYILKEKQKQGLITGYKEYKETQGTAHRVAGVEIFTEAGNKKA